MNYEDLMESIAELIETSTKVFKENPKLLLATKRFDKLVLERVRKIKTFQGIAFLFQDHSIILMDDTEIPILNKSYIGIPAPIHMQNLWEECINMLLKNQPDTSVKLENYKSQEYSKINVSVFNQHGKKFLAILLKESRTIMSKNNTFDLVREYYGNQKTFKKIETFQVIPTLGEAILVKTSFKDVEKTPIKDLDEVINKFNLI